MIQFPARALTPLCLCLLASTGGCAPAKPTAPPKPVAPPKAVAESAAAPPRNAPTEPTERARLTDTAINELSGLAASRRYPGLLWGHNDSGDSARIFAINGQGKTVATVNFAGLEARDWEDMTAAGEYLYIGEIGDNPAVNADIRVYRLREPDLNPDKLDQSITIENGAWEEMTLRYPDGARDAEALSATPDGRLLIVSKNRKGSNIYRSKRAFGNGQVATLEKIFDNVQVGESGWLTRLVTGGELSPDGRELALVTYSQVWQYKLAVAYDFATLQIQAPRKRALPPLKQCESLCYSADGRSLWVASEGEKAPLWELPLTQ